METENIIHKIKEFLDIQTGMHFENIREEILKKHINKRVNELKLKNSNEYLNHLYKSCRENNRKEIEKITSKITVNETYFFRDPKQFEYLQKIINILKKQQDKIRILSLGCATGEEAFSIAMCANEITGEDDFNKIEITAGDIDERIIRNIETRKYRKDDRRIKNISLFMLNKYFVKSNGFYKINDELKKKVNFMQLNLVALQLKGFFDIIFCKNVLYYFSENTKKTVLGKIFSILKPGGYFFVGTTEILNNLPDDIYRETIKSGFVYRKRAAESDKQNNKKNIISSAEDFKDNTFLKNKNKIPQYKGKNEYIFLQKNKTLKMIHKNDESVCMKRISGTIDRDTSLPEFNDFLEIIKGLFSTEKKNIIINFTDCKFLSYEAIEQIITLTKKIRNNGGDLVIVIQKGSLYSLLERQNINNIIKCCNTEIDAKSYYSKIYND